ncbi:2-hydroxyacid dehydrogenase [Rhizorhabdus sp. FW153]|uniref:2-hydroxyacid dehydrogenase n=1 Tax=Rhizorhabdus sp. FW153 TaxID=3400216 RepID=UPI003CE99590
MADRPHNPKLIVTRRLPAQVEARMRELFDVELNESDRPLSPAELAAAAARCDVLVPTITDEIDAAVIAAGNGRLGLIANFGNGVDHIDLKAARAARVIVTNTPGVLTADTADMTMALILSVPRRLAEGEKLVRSGTWTGWSPAAMLGHRIDGKTLGIIGMGRIGRAVARRARAFDLSIVYHNRHRLPEAVEQELDARFEPDLDRLLQDSDIVSIHCPHTPETENLIDARRIGLLSPHVYLINTARGSIVDEAALIDRLERGEIAGAGLDVFTHEPAVDPRLLALDNVVLLPHMGSATYEGRAETGERVIANIRQWADGQRPRDQIFEGWV